MSREPNFEPCVIEYRAAGHTEIVLTDCLTVWQPWGHEGVELGYDEQGLLIAVRVPGLVSQAAVTGED